MSEAMQNAIDFLLSPAQAAGDEVEVLAVQRKSTAISFQKQKMDQFSFSETQQLGVRVLDGNHEGVAYSESLQPESLSEMLREARANARMIKKERVSELQGAARWPTLPGLYDPRSEQVAVADKIALAQKLEEVALAYSPDIAAVAHARYADGAATVWIANSKGLRGQYRQNSCSAYAYCLANDGANKVMAGEAEVHRDFTSLSAERIARKAAEKALARRGASRPDTGKYTVVFENRAAESLIGLIADYFSGKAIDEGTSPLKGKLGQQIFSKQLSLSDDPLLVAAGGSRPFDEEGFASRQTKLVEHGKIQNFLTNSVLARKLNLPHTASASRSPSTELSVSPSNILVNSGNRTLAELLNADRRVLMVTNAMGFAGFRHASGDFSIPMEGQLYENGKLSSPLKDFLISGNILTLFADVEAVGSDALPPIGTVICPSLLVRGLNVAGQVE